jgi:peptidoglycan/xylan/chitin deacetylase (PgdA/CDA1 family)
MSDRVILCYHKISNDKANSNRYNVTYNKFRHQLKKLSNIYEFDSLDNFSIRADHPRCFITFDDGFRDNFDCAANILSELNVKTTFFVNSKHIESQIYYLSESLDMLLRDKDSYYNLSKLFRFSPIGDLSFILKKGVWEIVQFVNNYSPDKIWEVTKFFSRLCDSLDLIRRDSLPMELDHLKQFNASSIFTLGSHGHRHLNFANLTNSQVEYEINKSINFFQINNLKYVDFFAAPYGRKEHITSDIVDLLKVKYNFSTLLIEPKIFNTKNNFGHSRLSVLNWNGTTLTSYLRSVKILKDSKLLDRII